MSVKGTLGIVVASAALATGTFIYFEPHVDPPHHDTVQVQNQDGQASDAQEKVNERLDRDGKNAGDSELGKKAIPGEYRGPEPRLKPRIP